MKKRTVIISKINDDHTGYVLNMGIDELSFFKKLHDNGLELKGESDLSDEEILMLLRHCCIDGFIEAVYSIENHYNRDQKAINTIKDNIEKKLEAKGIQIINHCEWTPSFNSDGGVINKRNYLTILTQNISKKELTLSNIENELEELTKQKQELTEKIKSQNWYLTNSKNYEILYNIKKEEFDKLVERYNNGLKICEEQENNAKEKWPQELKDLEIQINEKNETIYEKNKNIEKLNIQIKELENKENNIQKSIENLNKNGSVILEKIIKKIFDKGILPKNELEAKFLNTYKMYIMNDWKFPEFEINFFKSQGLTDVDIQDLIKIFSK